jgi:hypothetical protein
VYIYPDARRSIGLRVGIYYQGFIFQYSQACRQVYRRCSFAYAAFLVGNTNDFAHFWCVIFYDTFLYNRITVPFFGFLFFRNDKNTPSQRKCKVSFFVLIFYRLFFIINILPFLFCTPQPLLPIFIFTQTIKTTNTGTKLTFLPALVVDYRWLVRRVISPKLPVLFVDY